MSTGNLAKKRHLDIPTRDITRTGPSQKMIATATSSTSYMVRSHTKRNLFNQYNDESAVGFARPNAKAFQTKRPLTSIKKGVSIFNTDLKCFFPSSSNHSLSMIKIMHFSYFFRHWLTFRQVKSSRSIVYQQNDVNQRTEKSFRMNHL